MKRKTKVFIISSLLSFAFLTTPQVLAMSLVDTSASGYATGNYTLNDVRNYAIYIMRLILSLVGTLSLIFFVYGGITFILSAGNQSQVKKGMDIIKAAVVGIIITFASVLLINLFFGAILADTGNRWNPNSGAIEK